MAKATATKKKSQVRNVLVILSNRLNKFHKVKFVELEADDEGTILKEKALRSEPKKPVYDEVWENDDGRSSVALCNRFKKRYGHKLQRKT
jgi:hypothetical protein